MKQIFTFILLLWSFHRISAQVSNDSLQVQELERKVEQLESLVRENAMRLRTLEEGGNAGVRDSTIADSSSKKEKPESPFSLSAYLDLYFAAYSDSVGQGNFQQFPTTSPRSNSFGLNIVMVTAKYSEEKVHAAVTLHYGDLPLSTWSEKYNFIQEAFAGVRLCKKLWLDAGFFKTHLGTEAILPRDNMTSSYSVNSYFEPYFESGIRLDYKPCEKFSLQLYGLNGYNMFEDNNQKKSLGLLATWSISDNFNINYSNYFGDDSPEGDSLKRMQFFNNFYLNLQGKKLKLQIGGDYCIQQNGSLDSFPRTAAMFSALASLKYRPHPKFAVYGRGDIFKDDQGFLSGTFLDKSNHVTGLKCWSATAGLEYNPSNSTYIRLECRKIIADADQEIFRWEGINSSSRLEAMVNMGISF